VEVNANNEGPAGELKNNSEHTRVSTPNQGYTNPSCEDQAPSTDSKVDMLLQTIASLQATMFDVLVRCGVFEHWVFGGWLSAACSTFGTGAVVFNSDAKPFIPSELPGADAALYCKFFNIGAPVCCSIYSHHVCLRFHPQ